MFHSIKKNDYKNQMMPVFSRSIMSIILVVLFLSSQASLAEADNPSLSNQKKTASGSTLKEEPFFKKIKSSRDQIYKLSHDVIKELEVHRENLNSLKEAVNNDTKAIIQNFIEKTRGMNLEDLKSQWKIQNSQQEQAFNKLIIEVMREQKKLNEILFKLKTVSIKVEDFLSNVDSQFQDFEKLIPSLSQTSPISSALNNRISSLKVLFEGVERDVRKRLNDQMEKADELHEVFETFIRTKWGLAYDTRKVIDRFFLANDPLGDSVFMLKSKTSGIIKEIKKKTFKTTKTSSESVYFLKVYFSDLCSNEKPCAAEELWMEYNPELNSKLNRPLEITADASQSRITDKGEEDIRVGDTINVREDGVTAFTAESSLDTIQESADSSDEVSFDNTIKNEIDSAKNIEIPLTKRRLAEVRAPEQSKAGKLINAANGFSVSCQEYIQKDNQFGTIGKAILKNINLDTTPVLFHNDIGDLKAEPKKICPNYSHFSQAEKVDFMVYYSASIGMVESSCNSHVKAKGPNGTLIGQWQLHLGKTHFYANNACGKINPSIGAQNTVCGLKMLNFYTKMPKNTKKELFYSRNYWETMHYPRPGAKKALALIHKFPGCFSR